jgi:hypothetical protein
MQNFEIVIKLTVYGNSQADALAEVEKRITHPDGARNDPKQLFIVEANAKRAKL